MPEGRSETNTLWGCSAFFLFGRVRLTLSKPLPPSFTSSVLPAVAEFFVSSVFPGSSVQVFRTPTRGEVREGMKTMYTPTTSGTFLERLAGALAMSTFSTCYFYAVLWLPAVRRCPSRGTIKQCCRSLSSCVPTRSPYAAAAVFVFRLVLLDVECRVAHHAGYRLVFCSKTV